jgi:hypothetical protein
MPAFTVNDFEGNSYEEKLEACFAAFTPRQQARLAALKERKSLDLREWPAIYLEKKEYFQWMHQTEELEQLHEEIQILEARNKEERDAKKAANIQKGKDMAKIPGKRAGSDLTQPVTKKVLGKVTLRGKYPSSDPLLGSYANMAQPPAPAPTPAAPAAAPAAPPAPPSLVVTSSARPTEEGGSQINADLIAKITQQAIAAALASMNKAQ